MKIVDLDNYKPHPDRQKYAKTKTNTTKRKGYGFIHNTTSFPEIIHLDLVGGQFLEMGFANLLQENFAHSNYLSSRTLKNKIPDTPKNLAY